MADVPQEVYLRSHTPVQGAPLVCRVGEEAVEVQDVVNGLANERNNAKWKKQLPRSRRQNALQGHLFLEQCFDALVVIMWAATKISKCRKHGLDQVFDLSTLVFELSGMMISV